LRFEAERLRFEAERLRFEAETLAHGNGRTR
jgi:hypothetical protein